MDAISEVRLGEIFPALAVKVRTMTDMLAQENIVIRVTQALRSWAAQDLLYARGRTLPGEIVTNVAGGRSWHCFGLAVDCVPSTHGPGQPYDPDWNKNHSTWIRMEAVGQSLGLESGALWRSFPDAPHFQLNGRFPVGAPNDEVRQLFRDGGMQAVWEEITKEAV